jgi:hypothetical protein
MFSYSTGYYVSPPHQYLKFKNRCSLMATVTLYIHPFYQTMFREKQSSQIITITFAQRNKVIYFMR